MLSRLGEQRYVPSQEGRAVAGGATEVPHGGSPPALCVDAGPPADPGTSRPQPHPRAEQRWCWDWLGSESQTCGNGLRLLTPARTPSSLLQKGTEECLPPGASVTCSQVCGPFSNMVSAPNGVTLGLCTYCYLSWTLSHCARSSLDLFLYSAFFLPLALITPHIPILHNWLNIMLIIFSTGM